MSSLKSTQAFAGSNDGRTALVVNVPQSLGLHFLVCIDHQGGAYKKHPVFVDVAAIPLIQKAERFLETGETPELPKES